MATPQKRKRCPNGSRRNKKTGECEPTQPIAATRRRIVRRKRIPIPSSPVFVTATSRRKRIPIPSSPKKVKIPSHIKAFLERGPLENQTRFLKAVCNSAHYCTAFGRETARIDHFFDFTNLKHIFRVGMINKGKNGVVNELIFERNGYKASTILKSTLDENSSGSSNNDNLYVEGFNGINFINKFAQQFPCFVKTYGLYSFKHANLKRITHKIAPGKPLKLVDPDVFNKNLSPVPINAKYDAARSCTNATRFAILLEHMHSPTTLYDWITKAITSTTERRKCDFYYTAIIPSLLFQIYAVLSTLASANMFTHYDLHMDNVLLYKIPDEKHIIMQYKNAVNGETIEFPTQFIVKLIDYGRSYLPDNEAIYKDVCKTRNCNPNCGEHAGYSFPWETKQSLPENYYISQQTLNQSIDLKTAVNISSHIPKAEFIMGILNKIKYDNKFDGAPPTKTTTKPSDFSSVHLDTFPQIKNVEELYWALYYFMKNLKATGYYSMTGPLKYMGEQYGTMTIDLKYNHNNIRPLSFIIGK